MGSGRTDRPPGSRNGDGMRETARCGLHLRTPYLPNSIFQEWSSSLPAHLLFSAHCLAVQKTMFETASNLGAWCYAAIHVYYASCSLGIIVVSTRRSDFCLISYQYTGATTICRARSCCISCPRHQFHHGPNLRCKGHAFGPDEPIPHP